MLTKDDAVRLVRASLPENMDLDESHIVEREYGWVLFPQSKEWLRTRDPRDALIGNECVLVEQTSGRMFHLGPAYRLEDNLQIYELGYMQHESWDLVIKKVTDERSTIEAILRLKPTYVVPEEAYGEVWRIPQKYNPMQLKQKLRVLPARFKLGSARSRWRELEGLKDQKAFIYDLVPNEGYDNTP
jgi:hypothetical protein